MMRDGCERVAGDSLYLQAFGDSGTGRSAQATVFLVAGRHGCQQALERESVRNNLDRVKNMLGVSLEGDGVSCEKLEKDTVAVKGRDKRV